MSSSGSNSSGKGQDARAKPGAVKHDTRGNAVWQWALDTGKHALDSTSALLRRLDLSGLSIEGDESKKRQSESKSSAPELRIEEGGGYDPYGRSATRTPPRKPAAARPAAAQPLSPRAPGPGSRRSSWWRRLIGRR